jgi:hypothetical protein
VTWQALKWLARPPDPAEGWNSRPPAYIVRERAEAENLEPNALEAVKQESGIFFLNFGEAIVACISIYLRVSGLRSICEDFKRVNEFSDMQAETIRIQKLQIANLMQSAAVAEGELQRQLRNGTAKWQTWR